MSTAQHKSTKATPRDDHPSVDLSVSFDSLPVVPSAHSPANSMEVYKERVIKDYKHKLKGNTVKKKPEGRLLKIIQYWLTSFLHLDPRHQILCFFSDVAQNGVEQMFKTDEVSKVAVEKVSPIIRRLVHRANGRLFHRANVFSVWRPTSGDAIRKMIKGDGTGKGMDIKGKSARQGKLSAYIPFMQIHDEKHKEKVCTMVDGNTLRIFYPDEGLRDSAHKELVAIQHEMALGVSEMSERTSMSSDSSYDGEMDKRFNRLNRWTMKIPAKIIKLDMYASSECYGLQIPERVFWEAYVNRRVISRKPGSLDETGRPSMPDFQDMNFVSLRKFEKNKKVGNKDPRPVIWYNRCNNFKEEQPKKKGEVPAKTDPGCTCTNPLCPLSLLVAYEDNQMGVKPVVSDFDCFLLGTRGVKYNEPLPEQAAEMLSSSLGDIEEILKSTEEDANADLNWTSRWLEVMKKNALNEKLPKEVPKFGYADPRSYEIMTGAVDRLKENGAVRHGPECFNYGFPQELDPEYLVVSSSLEGNVRWEYVNSQTLIGILSKKIDEGFTFPLNPKWLLCDKGWKGVYDKLRKSTRPNVQESLAIWYPRDIHERIESISARFPNGFVSERIELGMGNIMRDLAEQKLDRYLTLRRARTKLRAIINVMSLYKAPARCKSDAGPALEDAASLNEEPYDISCPTAKVKAIVTLLHLFARESVNEEPTNILQQAKKDGIIDDYRKDYEKRTERLKRFRGSQPKARNLFYNSQETFKYEEPEPESGPKKHPPDETESENHPPDDPPDETKSKNNLPKKTSVLRKTPSVLRKTMPSRKTMASVFHRKPRKDKIEFDASLKTNYVEGAEKNASNSSDNLLTGTGKHVTYVQKASEEHIESRPRPSICSEPSLGIADFGALDQDGSSSLLHRSTSIQISGSMEDSRTSLQRSSGTLNFRYKEKLSFGDDESGSPTNVAASDPEDEFEASLETNNVEASEEHPDTPVNKDFVQEMIMKNLKGARDKLSVAGETSAAAEIRKHAEELEEMDKNLHRSIDLNTRPHL